MNSIQSFGHSMLHYITGRVAEAGKTLTEKVNELSSYIQLLAVGYQDKTSQLDTHVQKELTKLIEKATTPGRTNREAAISIIQNEFKTPEGQLALRGLYRYAQERKNSGEACFVLEEALNLMPTVETGEELQTLKPNSEVLAYKEKQIEAYYSFIKTTLHPGLKKTVENHLSNLQQNINTTAGRISQFFFPPKSEKTTTVVDLQNTVTQL